MDIVALDRCSIEDLSSGPRPNQKYMVNSIADRVVYLERRMMGFAEALEQAHSISATNSLSTPCQVPVAIISLLYSPLPNVFCPTITKAGLLHCFCPFRAHGMIIGMTSVQHQLPMVSASRTALMLGHLYPCTAF